MKRHLLTGTLIAALAVSTAASADTLREALNATYRANPTLTGQREALKVDRFDRRHRSRRGPPAGLRHGRGQPRPDLAAAALARLGKGPYLTGGVDLSYPLFSGGSVRNSITAAKTRVEAGRATLRAVEGDVFTEAVAAYMDVIRDRVDRRAERESGARARHQSRGDARPVPDRRRHPHRRRPVRGAPVARPQRSGDGAWTADRRARKITAA